MNYRMIRRIPVVELHPSLAISGAFYGLSSTFVRILQLLKALDIHGKHGPLRKNDYEEHG